MDALYRTARPLLFALPAEGAHHFGLNLLRLTGAAGMPSWSPPETLRQELLGVKFQSPVGLAAGFDKDARCLAAWPRLGFGFAEVGTVTPRAQPGNPKPRLLRHKRQRSLQNWMGFNGRGVGFLAANLRARPTSFPVAVNLGKNADTPMDNAADDYLLGIRATVDLCDFLVVNVSSPNTPGLRKLQKTSDLMKLLRPVVELANPKPVLVKLSPDEEIADLCELSIAAVDQGCTGVVVSNTSVDYELLDGTDNTHKGGISGRLITNRSRLLTAKIGAALQKRGILVSVGGIDSAEEAYRRIRTGASLVELYTGLVYRGPGLPQRIAEGLATLAQADGAKSINEVVGADL